jgi:hypothetical protein
MSTYIRPELHGQVTMPPCRGEGGRGPAGERGELGVERLE